MQSSATVERQRRTLVNSFGTALFTFVIVPSPSCHANMSRSPFSSCPCWHLREFSLFGRSSHVVLIICNIAYPQSRPRGSLVLSNQWSSSQSLCAEHPLTRTIPSKPDKDYTFPPIGSRTDIEKGSEQLFRLFPFQKSLLQEN